MKKCKYYVGCYSFSRDINGFRSMRIITNIQNGIPLFEKDKSPMEFTSEEADVCMRRLIDEGWVAVTIRTPHDRKHICWN